MAKAAPPWMQASMYPTVWDVDHDNNIYIADTLNNRIRKVNAFNGTVTTIAGQGAPRVRR